MTDPTRLAAELLELREVYEADRLTGVWLIASSIGLAVPNGHARWYDAADAAGEGNSSTAVADYIERAILKITPEGA